MHDECECPGCATKAKLAEVTRERDEALASLRTLLQHDDRSEASVFLRRLRGDDSVELDQARAAVDAAARALAGAQETAQRLELERDEARAECVHLRSLLDTDVGPRRW